MRWSPLWILGPLVTLIFSVSAFKLDRKCTPGQWKVFHEIHKNNTCHSCFDCPNGQGLPVKCDTVITHVTELECVKCISGVNSSAGNNMEQCQPCQSTTCLLNEIVNGTCFPDELDTTICTGICKKGFFMNSDKTRCVRLNIIGAGDEITVNKTVNKTVATKMDHRSGFSIDLIVIGLIVIGCLVIISGVAYCCYKKSSHNQDSENMELGQFRARTPCNSEECPETETLIGHVENNDQLPSPNFAEVPQELSPQETASTDSEPIARTSEAENEAPQELSPQDTSSTDSEGSATTSEIENVTSLPLSLSTPNHTPPSSPRRRLRRKASPTFSPQETSSTDSEPSATTSEIENEIFSLNQNYYSAVCLKLNKTIQDKDWKAVAGKMGYSNEKVSYYAKFNKDNPTDALLRDWETKDGNDVHALIKICEEIERDDVAKILKVASGIRPRSGVQEESS